MPDANTSPSVTSIRTGKKMDACIYGNLMN